MNRLELKNKKIVAKNLTKTWANMYKYQCVSYFNGLLNLTSHLNDVVVAMVTNPKAAAKSGIQPIQYPPHLLFFLIHPIVGNVGLLA